MILTTKCPFCEKTRNIDIDRVAWKEYLCPECFPKEEENE